MEAPILEAVGDVPSSIDPISKEAAPETEPFTESNEEVRGALVDRGLKAYLEFH